MNRHDVRLVQQIMGYPCVSITLPTHRTAPENRQDPVRVKNLVREAVNRLLNEFPKREVEPILISLEKLAEDIDYNYLLDGLVLYANQDFSRSFVLPFTVPERVVIDDTFLTRDLVYALNHTTRYWVLSLSEKPTRLYEGTLDNLVEIQNGNFPMEHTMPGGSQSLPGGRGIRKSAYRDEYHRKFFRQVDSALKPFMDTDRLPLIVVGVDRYHAFFNEITNYQDIIFGRITGNHDTTPAHELSKLVWPLVQEKMAEKRKQMLSELEKALSDRKVATEINDIWRKSLFGRGRHLLVEENYHFAARLDETGQNLTLAEDVTAPDVIDDAVDEIIEAVINTGGEVTFLLDGQLEKYQRMALILRY
ncbi:MAG TPA: hypothetical protein PLE10_04665 [Brevefilum sp.]|nr:hypothetical protein [Brevefilum sp.]HOR19107.1 hypothetical protein [Brevefilum sp.]HPL68905.1 hypothetical protein [Brevefilum sp.]